MLFWLNAGIRRLHLSFTLPAIEFFLNLMVRRKIRIVPRQSLSRSSDFHFFWSDLDLATVGEMDADDWNRLRAVYRRLQSAVFVLGELEIYSPNEWQERTILYNEICPLYEDLRVVRKTKWMERSIPQISNVLARQRAIRGFENCLLKLGEETKSNVGSGLVANAIEAHLVRILRPYVLDSIRNRPDLNQLDGLVFYVPWIESSIRVAIDGQPGSPIRQPGEFILSPEIALILASLFFEVSYGQEQIDAFVTEIRRDPKIQSLLFKMASFERLVVTATIRGIQPAPEWSVGTLNTLNRLLKNN